MKKGFIFRNRHSDEFGITMQSKSRPILPEMKAYTYDAPLLDGVYDFSSANAVGRTFFQNRAITVNMRITAEDINALEERASRIAVWLSGTGELMFDDMPLVKWRATVRNTIDFVPERYGKTALLSVTFDTKPFSECVFDTENGAELDSCLKLDTDIPLNIGYAFTYECVNGVISFYNYGTAPTKPIFKFTAVGGGVKKIKIYTTCGNKLIYENTEGKSPVMFDFENQTVTDAAGNDLISYTKGGFAEFKPGLTYISVSCDTETALEIIYAPSYIYNFEWGRNDA